MTLHRQGIVVKRKEAEAFDAAAIVLAGAGLAFTLERGRRHLKIAVEGHGITIANSPRTDNHVAWAQQGARRVVREIMEAREQSESTCK